MKGPLLFVFASFLPGIGLYAQPDTTTVNDLNRLAWEMKFSNPDSAALVSEKAARLATDLGFQRGIADAHKTRGVIMHIRGNFDSVFQLATASYEIYSRIQHRSGMAATMNLTGLAHYSLGNYPEALRKYLDVARIYETLGDQAGLAKTYNNIGNTFYKQADDDNALAYYRKAYAIHVSEENKPGQMEALSNVAMVLMEKKAYEEALDDYATVEQFAVATGNKLLLAGTWQNMAICHRYQGDLKSAESYYSKSLTLKTELDDPDGICSSLTGMAIIARAKKEYQRAHDLTDQVIRKASESKLLDRLNNAYEIKYQVFRDQENFSRALETYQLYTVTKDSLFNIHKARQVQELQLKYETEKKEHQILLLQKEAEVQAALKNRAIIISAGIALVLVLAVYGLRLRNKLYKERNAKLEIENKLKEQENLRLAEELRAENEINRIQSEKHTMELDFKNRELTSAALHAVQKSDLLQDLREQLEELAADKDLKTAIKPLLKTIDTTLDTADEWDNTKLHFEKVHPGFFERLQTSYPELTQTELKHIAYMKINLSGKEIARLLNIGVKAIQMSRYRIKKKIGLSEEVNLLEFIQQF
ncbi:MAG TPA: tetratricopeptide repeat protein [Chryseosolibacter sp.]|nr:tetratricopeptide repeat protein [Chryseosolibacter sp.]